MMYTTKYEFNIDGDIVRFTALTDDKAIAYVRTYWDLYGADNFSLVNLRTNKEITFDYL